MPKKNRRKLRALGKVLLEMEPLILEAVCDHDLQWSDFLALMHAYLQVHCPDAQEKYLDGSSPKYSYGFKKD